MSRLSHARQSADRLLEQGALRKADVRYDAERRVWFDVELDDGQPETFTLAQMEVFALGYRRGWAARGRQAKVTL
jgi:hypothetical protein